VCIFICFEEESRPVVEPKPTARNGNNCSDKLTPYMESIGKIRTGKDRHAKCTVPERHSNPLAQVAHDPVIHKQREVLMLCEVSVYTRGS